MADDPEVMATIPGSRDPGNTTPVTLLTRAIRPERLEEIRKRLRRELLRKPPTAPIDPARLEEIRERLRRGRGGAS